MKLLATAVSVLLITGCATQKGNDRHAQHGADQIRMVAVQREALLKEEQAQAQANEKLYEALARVAESNPQHAPSVAVALAVIGVSGGQSREGDTDRVVTLQAAENTALEWTKALAPTVGGLVTGLGIAAINADVTKTQSDNNARIQINDALQDKNIVDAVAGLGTAAANSVGISVGGDYYDLEDQAGVDNSVNTTETYNTTTTSTVSDSYNEGSYNSTSADTSTETQNTITMSTTLTYAGSEMTLADLIAQLQAAGANYSIDLDGDGVAEVSGDGGGETVTIDCQFYFSPQHPDCV
jgi:hypothetical protein